MCEFPKKYFLDDEIDQTPSSSEVIKLDLQQEPVAFHISKRYQYGILSICQNDRVQFDAKKAPHKYICRLLIKDNNNDYHIATGFFISPRCVITSGHCVFFDGDWVKSITVIPGANGENSKTPFGSQKSYKFKSVKGWTVYNNRNYDYGAIILPDNTLYNRLEGYLDAKVLEKEKLVFNYGYTDESDKRHEQWGDFGNIDKTTTFRIYYYNDTEKGNSGSPILILEDLKYKVVGIHSFGNCPNFAIKVNKVILKKWNNWKVY